MNKTHVKLCRQTLGLSQAQFAVMLGVSRAVISNIESSYRKPNRKFVTLFNQHVDAELQAKVIELNNRGL